MKSRLSSGRNTENPAAREWPSHPPTVGEGKLGGVQREKRISSAQR